MKTLCLSDIHGNWKNIIKLLKKYDSIYEIELIIICGDLFTSDDIQSQKEEIIKYFPKFYEVFSYLPDILIVPGNHDFLLERIYNDPIMILKFFKTSKVKILVDSGYDIQGIKFYGNPRCDLYSFAFPHLYKNQDIDSIPNDIDVLITHEAPRIEGLSCITDISYQDGSIPGNIDLAKRVLEIKPRFHIFGHIHKSGLDIVNGITFLNASQCLENYYKPELFIIDINKYDNR